ncbi:hypothetical protein AMS68_001777 [Peltaster fructicola]|uniref:NADH:flavin oxidoreductase/NADH oxidase N-terminal domain-containing protein n=1 Tax=Peltaster fructicola TaxID=286661 RepID=A0A6H0XP46_9PEZI|nr:hypothetical protein AMS68_001777 [Peltaster fructicola]
MSQQSRYASEEVDASPLAQPLHFEFSGRTAPNRFLKAAMSERIASWDDKDLSKRGIPTQESINLYRRWREAGAGIVLSGHIIIDTEQIEGPGNLMIPPDAPLSGERFEAFKAMAAAGKTGDNLIIGQVSHPGRQATELYHPHPLSASDVQLQGNIMGMTFGKPRAATQEDINNLVKAFAHAAEFLEKAGWDGIELHGAHGYLLSQFLAPATNHRTDQYGGSLENRARIIVEIAKAIRARTSPGFILSIKLNSVEFQDEGLQSEEAREICEILDQNTFDFVELSGGTYESLGFKYTKESTVKREAFFIEFAELISPVLSKTKVYVTGGFKTVGGMVAALKGVDGVGIGRALAAEPRLVKDIVSGRVKSALAPAVAPDDFATTMLAAGVQIKQIGRDQEPLDISNEQSIAGLKAAFGDYLQKGVSDSSKSPIDFLSADPVPYGPLVA